jgi:hypothetical protein
LAGFPQVRPRWCRGGCDEDNDFYRTVESIEAYSLGAYQTLDEARAAAKQWDILAHEGQNYVMED